MAGAFNLRLEGGSVLPVETVGQGLGNWVQYMGITGSPLTRQPVPGVQTAPSSTCIFAAVLDVLSTGIFWLSVGAMFSDNTDADVVTLSLVGTETAGAGILSCVGTGGFVGAGQASNNTAFQSGVVGGDQAGGNGILLDGVAINTLGASPYPRNGSGTTVPTGAGGGGTGTQDWSWSGLVSAGAITKTPFTVGQKVCFGVLLTSSGGKVVTVGSANLLLVEWPFG
jgi:hypothetical protein